MHRRATVFDSRSERRIFQRLTSRWRETFDLFAQMPLSKVIATTRDELTFDEYRWYLQASIDYVVCERATGEPLLGIDFDGLAGGMSQYGRYIPGTRPSQDARRHLRIWKKVRLAARADFPYVVVSFPETVRIAGTRGLTILDGIVGQVVARRRFEGALRATNTHGVSYEDTQELVWDLETLAELDHDPLAQTASRAEYRWWQATGFRGRIALECFTDPPAPEIESILDVEAMRARAEAFQNAERIGCRCEAVYDDRVEAAVTVYIRNVGSPWITTSALAKYVATMLAIDDALALPRPTQADGVASAAG